MTKTVSTSAPAKPDTRQRIRILNDALRAYGIGGRVIMTSGVAGLDDAARRNVVKAIRAFDTFDTFDDANDPHGEHDCAVVDVDGLTIMFKIDYYDLTLSHHSPDPADPP